MDIRRENWERVKSDTFDVVVIGGGINCSCLYDHLCRKGYKVFLVDKGDFGGGTSQASGMMVWGGLLYLRNLEFLYVRHLCRAREFMLREMNALISPCTFRYIVSANGGRKKRFVQLATYLYWFLGGFERRIPLSESRFAEASLLKNGKGQGSLLFEEAMLNISDCRFILNWIIPHQSSGSLALNYCSLEDGTYQPAERLWYLNLKDTLGNCQATVRAKCVVNCAGVWTDELNRRFRIETPCKHVFSKGVYLGFQRPAEHRGTLIFETGTSGDTITLIPWGPLSLWGPTETMTQSIQEGYSPGAGDVQYLQEQAEKNFNANLDTSRIVSFRCGIRPLVVDKSFTSDCYPLDISRKPKIVKDDNLPWISAFGGKITGCLFLAEEIGRQISRFVPTPPAAQQSAGAGAEATEWTSFPGLAGKVPSLRWCLRHEFCCTLEDYLRRRTNISQWIPREGLGFDDENLPHLKKLAFELSGNDSRQAEITLELYRERVRSGFDRLAGKDRAAILSERRL